MATNAGDYWPPSRPSYWPTGLPYTAVTTTGTFDAGITLDADTIERIAARVVDILADRAASKTGAGQ